MNGRVYKTAMSLTIFEVSECKFGGVLEFFGRGRGQTNDDRENKTEDTMSQRVLRNHGDCMSYQTLRRIQTLCSLAITFVPRLQTSAWVNRTAENMPLKFKTTLMVRITANHSHQFWSLLNLFCRGRERHVSAY
jgi:hypothetical protein